MKTTEWIMKEVDKQMTSNLMGVRRDISELNSSVAERFEKLYCEELWKKGEFGPIEGDKFPTMKEWLISNLNLLKWTDVRAEEKNN